MNINALDARLRGHDDLFRASLKVGAGSTAI
jgi:hypothetical protein